MKARKTLSRKEELIFFIRYDEEGLEFLKTKPIEFPFREVIGNHNRIEYGFHDWKPYSRTKDTYFNYENNDGSRRVGGQGGTWKDITIEDFPPEIMEKFLQRMEFFKEKRKEEIEGLERKIAEGKKELESL